MCLPDDEKTSRQHPEAEVTEPALVTVDAKALRQVLQALIGPPHHVRELQATRTPESLFPENPINVLVDQYNSQMSGSAASSETE